MSISFLQTNTLFSRYTIEQVLIKFRKLVADGYLTERSHPEHSRLRIFNYTDKCTYDKRWNEFTLSARGVVIDTTALQLVALPFPKIFNFSELGPIDPKSLPTIDSVVEKMDGSLGIIFHYDGLWHCATRGSFESDQAKWATAKLRGAIAAGLVLEKNYTYLVEIIYEANRVVLHYLKDQLALIGCFDRTTYTEIDINNIWPTFEPFALFSLPQKYPLHPDVPAWVNTLKDKEGVVVRFQDGTRLKFKTEEYCTLHRIKFGLTPLAVWDAMVQGKIEEYAVQVPEEFQLLFKSIWANLAEKASSIRQNAIMWLLTDNKNLLSRKELALELEKSNYPYRGIIWMLYDNKSESEIEQSILKRVRPQGNIL